MAKIIHYRTVELANCHAIMDLILLIM